MEFLLQSVTIIAPGNSLDGKTVDLLIKEGTINKITQANQLTEKSDDGERRVLPCQGKYLSIGWFDLKAHFSDPGEEYKEDLVSGSKVAAAGGFTEVALIPNTIPVVQNKNSIRYVQSSGYYGNNRKGYFNSSLPTQLHAIGAVTKDTAGKELTEMIDLHEAGAVAFSDGDHPLWHSRVMLKALQYTQNFNGLLINKPEDRNLNAHGVMNEGIQSTMLGMAGMPSLAEELMIERDLKLLQYTTDHLPSDVYSTARLHFSNISTATAVEMIRKAKQNNLQVTCDVAAHQLFFDDTMLTSFDTNYKVNPPFRTREDIEMLIRGLEDGTIDAIVSGHMPQDEENKKCEFELAGNGIIGLQTVYPILGSLEGIAFKTLIEKITTAPRKILQMEVPEIKEGALANLTLFDPQKEWQYNGASNFSKSKNSPLYGAVLKGKPLATFHQGVFWLDPETAEANAIQ